MSFLDEMFGSGNKYKLSDEFIHFLSERFQTEFDGWIQLRLDAEKEAKEAEANKPLDLETMAEAARKEVAKHIETSASKHLSQFKHSASVVMPRGIWGSNDTSSILSETVGKNSYSSSLQTEKFVTREEFFSLFNQFTIFGYTFFYKKNIKSVS